MSQPTIEERLERVFEADADANGLSAGEVSERQWERLSAADVNEDGTVSREELTTHLETKEAEREKAVRIADLDKEDGTFHEEDTGVHHHGFESSALQSAAEEAGFTDVTVEPVMGRPSRVLVVKR